MSPAVNQVPAKVVTFLLGLVLIPCLLLFADIRPLDPGRERDAGGTEGKEKDEKNAVPVLDRGDEADRLQAVVRDGEANLKEIQRLIDEIQKNLSGRDTGAETQGKQRDVVTKMQKLIEALEKECSKCSGGGQSSGQKQSPIEKQQKADEKPQQEQGQKQEPKEAKKSGAQLQESERDRKEGKVDNKRVADAKPEEARAGSLREQLLEMSRRWGLLPPKLREEMLFSTGREAPREYIEIISRYYKRLAELYQQSGGR